MATERVCRHLAVYTAIASYIAEFVCVCVCVFVCACVFSCEYSELLVGLWLMLRRGSTMHMQ